MRASGGRVEQRWQQIQCQCSERDQLFIGEEREEGRDERKVVGWLWVVPWSAGRGVWRPFVEKNGQVEARQQPSSLEHLLANQGWV